MPASKKTARKTAASASKKASPVTRWTKPPEAHVRLFARLMLTLPEAQMRQMFGCPAAFANGNLFVCLHQDNIVLRLPDDERAAFMALPGAHAFEPMPGRQMREYVCAPPQLIAAPAELGAWLEKAYAYAGNLAPKKTTRRK